jgi:hypothetical protein
MRTPAFALSLLFLLLGTGPARAAEVRTGHEPGYDFSRVKTYRWATEKGGAMDPGLDRRIRAEVTKGLAAKGLRQLPPGEEPADVLLRYNVGAADGLVAGNVVSVGWYGDLIAVPGARSDVRAGLLLEMLEPESGKLLWGATYIMRGNTPQALQVMADRAERAVRGVLKKYPPK